MALAPYGLVDPELTVEVVEHIPRHASTGKLKRFVALR
jgi:phenylacetate-CoA ligase